MVSFESFAMIVFFLAMALFWYAKRNEIEIQKIFFPIIYFMMYKTKVGLTWMDAVARKHRRLVQWLAAVGVIVGFLGMAYIGFVLVENLIKVLTVPGTAPALSPVAPVKIKGFFYVPFFYWIISIFFIAGIHEYAHGVVARAYGIRVLSSGIAFLNIILPIIPAAFVEPDEKQIVKRPAKEQLGVFAAGAFSNIISFFILFLILLYAITPVANSLVQPNGMLINKLHKEEGRMFPAEIAGLTPGELILSIDNSSTLTEKDFISALDGKKPGDRVTISTNVSIYHANLTANPKEPSKAYLGVFVEQATTKNPEAVKKYGLFFIDTFFWLTNLIYVMAILSLGIGLFNLLPLGPIDGGRMLLVPCQIYLGKEKGELVWKLISFFFLGLLLINLAFAFLK